MKTPDDYRGPLGTEYELPDLLGGTVIPILEILWGLPWGDIPLCYIRTVNPSCIRVTNGETKTDYRPQRVTVYVDGNDVIESIEQEATIAGGSGYEMGLKLKKAKDESRVLITPKGTTWDQAVIPALDLEITFSHGPPESGTEILTITDKGQVIPARDLTRMEAIYQMAGMLRQEGADLERERCVKALCKDCAAGLEAIDVSGDWMHRHKEGPATLCDAQPIRELGEGT